MLLERHDACSLERDGIGGIVRGVRSIHGNDAWLDVHGAGAQRSDPKTGNPSEYQTGRGPQGDAIRIYNYIRCVRDIQQYSPIPDWQIYE